MIARIEELLANNKAFVAEQLRLDPAYFGKTNIIQDAWARGGHPFIHGWVFDLASGYIQPQTSMINNNDAILEVCKFHNGNVGEPAIRPAA
jgi:carbonic anhydrase